MNTLFMNWLNRPMMNAEGEGGAGGSTPATAGDQAAADVSAATTADAQTTAREAKPEGEAKPDDKAAEGEQAPDESAPFSIEVPKGMEDYSAEFTGYSDAVNGFLKDNPKATARDALKWAAEYQSQAAQKGGADAVKQFNDTVTAWENEIRSDPDMGGANYDKTVQDARKGIEVFGNDALRKVLSESGLGSHPEVLRAFAKAGKQAQESPILGGEGNKGGTSFAGALFGGKKG